MRAFAASRTTRDLARMLSREVGFRTDGARRRLGGATYRGVAVQAAAAAACGGSEGEVVPHTDLAVKEVEEVGAVDDVLHRELPDKRDHDGRCLLSSSLGFGGEPAWVATHAKLGVEHGELVSHLLHGGCSRDTVENEPRPSLADDSCGGGKAVLIEGVV
jgi:hypothetical protein